MPSSLDLALGGTVVVLILVFAIYVYLREKRVRNLQDQLRKRQTQAYTAGVNQTKGDVVQVLGTFSTLNDYDNILFLSSASKQCSVDLLGVGPETLDFIEVKKKGASLKPNEKNLRRLVEEKKVRYRVLDVELPESVTVEERTLLDRRKSKSNPGAFSKSSEPPVSP